MRRHNRDMASLWLPGFEPGGGVASAPAPDDAAARERALDPARSFIVQAPAGSGKTELLIQRYLTLLARVAEPESIVAITFTIKAAGEMRSRVLDALRRAAGPAPASEHSRRTWEIAREALRRDRERGWDLAAHPGRMRIQTIDALSMAIVRQMPLLARFGALPDVTDKPQEYYWRATSNTLRLLAGKDPYARAIEALLRRLDNDANYACTLLAQMLETRDHWMRLLGSAADLSRARAALESTLGEIVSGRLAMLAQSTPEALAREWVALGRYAAANAEPGHEIASCRDLQTLPGVAPECLAAWRGLRSMVLTGEGELRKAINSRCGFPKEDRAAKQRWSSLMASIAQHDELLRLLRSLDELPPSGYTDAQWQTLEALFIVLPAAVAELRVLFAEAGVVDFTEVAQAALRALGSREHPTDLALTMGARIQHLLVDEFQDTSVTQYELLAALTAGWEAGDGRTVFVVGDPMQSIYRFRQAEVGLMLSMRQRGLGEIRPEWLQLTTNFRSARPVVEWINESFAPAFPPAADPYTGAAAYSRSTAWDRSDDGGVMVHPMLRRDDAAEADLVLQIIEHARRTHPAAKIAVLARSRTHLSNIAELLRRRRVSFRAIEVEALAERAVIHELIALTRAVLHPADRLAWLAVLRGPWCGLTLADLHAIAQPDPQATLWDALQRSDLALTADGAARVANIKPALERAMAARGRTPVRTLVERTWFALGGPACASSDADIEDARAYFDLLDRVARGGEVTDFDALAQGAADLFAAPDPESDGAIELMTMHKAKGLEFDTVILPGLGRTPRAEERKLLLWTERPSAEGERLVLAPVSPKRDDADALCRYIGAQEKIKDAHETVRLLYVAATRARRTLHLIGHADIEEDASGRRLRAPSPDSLLARIWPAVKPAFESALASYSPAQPESQPEKAYPLLRRAPQGWKPASPPDPLPLRRGAVDQRAGDPENAAREMARAAGTLVHSMLEKIAREGLERWPLSRLAGLRAGIRAALAHLGTAAPELERAAQRAEQALANTLEDPRGRWILAGHEAAQSELKLAAEVGGAISHFAIDRTFIEDGVRWVIDFKTVEYDGAEVDAFVESERRAYEAQLERYADLLAALDSRPIRAGLYFPMLRRWVEWTPRRSEHVRDLSGAAGHEFRPDQQGIGSDADQEE